MSFNELPDQPEARLLLAAAVREGPAHAYLFHGPRGVGKRAAARTFAAALGHRDDASSEALATGIFRMRVAALYDAMAAALRAGDWRVYGDAWAALGRLLGRPAP